MSQVRKGILNGWKEIANYVGRDLRTVERWEKQRGLPIHRLPGSGRATVYAHIEELNEWFASAGSRSADDTDMDASSDSLPFDNPAEITGTAETETEFHEETLLAADAGVSLEAETPWWRIPLMSVAIMVLAVVGLWVVVQRALKNEVSAGAKKGSTLDASKTMPGAPYSSTVPGVDDLYLRGVYGYDQRTPESLKLSENYFKQAIEKDSKYAPAYAGLSVTYLLLREYSEMTDAAAYPKAKDAAQRAVQMDPTLAQAHVSLGFIDFFWGVDPVGAEREFKTAVELDPSQALAHHWYGSVLTHEARYPEALTQLDMAQRLQPTSAAILSSRALALGLSGHRNEANDMLLELLKEVPGSASPHQMLSILSLVEPRDIPRWLDESRRVCMLRGDKDGIELIATAETTYRASGEMEMWQAMEAFEKKHQIDPAYLPYGVADAEAAQGHLDAAFAILETLVKQRSPSVIAIPMDPTLEALRKDPRYPALLAEIRIPDAVKVK